MSKGKFGDLIQKAREQDNQKTRGLEESVAARKPERKITRKPEAAIVSTDEMVNLGVKVSRRRRRHWAAESKRKGVSMTEVIITALVEEFGEPD
jgi:hypothetical protein